jgi:hypothetical protein
MRKLLVNQGWRPAWVLAELDGEALIEYEMPNGTSALRIATAGALAEDWVNLMPWEYRSVSYHALPRKWLRVLARYDEPWVGDPQQTRRPGTPADELRRRFGEEPPDAG